MPLSAVLLIGIIVGTIMFCIDTLRGKLYDDDDDE